MTTVGMNSAGEDARPVGCFQDHRTGAVAEQDTSAAVGPVENARKDFCANDQRPPRRSAGDELLSDSQSKHKATAHCLHVKGRSPVDDA